VSWRPTDSAAELGANSPLALRVRRGVRHPGNWLQLFQFCVVGGSGYAVNLGVFSLLVGVAGIHHLLAATIAFCVAVTNNFWLNRHWTFQARGGHAGLQAARFLTVSIGAFVFSVSVLELLVQLGIPEIAAQAIAIASATPLNFAGNKMWTFDRARGRA
jgi:putative flippase GtrA